MLYYLGFIKVSYEKAVILAKYVFLELNLIKNCK